MYAGGRFSPPAVRMDRILELAVEKDCLIRDLLRARFSGRRIHFLREKGHLLKNGQPVTVAERAERGDKLTLIFKETGSFDHPPQNLGIQVIYEDEDILVCYKPRGIPSMPAAPHFDNNLYNGIKFLRPEGVFRVVTRLDKDTSGIVLMAKNALAHSLLHENMADISKTYAALVRGDVSAPLTIDAPILSDGGRKRRVSPEGKPAITRIIGAKRMGENTCLTVRPETGRTHQIRVHLAYIGHPIVGDPLYGEGGDGQLLCCCGLEFAHPVTGEKLGFYIDGEADLGIK